MSLQIQGFYNALDTTPVKFWAIGSASDVNAVSGTCIKLQQFLGLLICFQTYRCSLRISAMLQIRASTMLRTISVSSGLCTILQFLGLLICFRHTGADSGFLLRFRCNCRFRASTELCYVQFLCHLICFRHTDAV